MPELSLTQSALADRISEIIACSIIIVMARDEIREMKILLKITFDENEIGFRETRMVFDIWLIAVFG